ncbi:MAG TPA: hypothetical protein VI894_00365 [Candidatus Nanoarchaeia archaeon]|nr:hypothetical protein [Candidatus Nanoarchaeia archaeon]
MRKSSDNEFSGKKQIQQIPKKPRAVQQYFDFAGQEKEEKEEFVQPGEKRGENIDEATQYFNELEDELDDAVRSQAIYFAPDRETMLLNRQELQRAISTLMKSEGNKVPFLREMRTGKMKGMYYKLHVKHEQSTWIFRETLSRWYDKYNVLPPNFQNISDLLNAEYTELRQGYNFIETNKPTQQQDESRTIEAIQGYMGTNPWKMH